MGSRTVRSEVETWALVKPFRISGYVWKTLDVLVVSVEEDEKVGRGEAAGVYYNSDHPRSMLAQIEQARETIEKGVERTQTLKDLPQGGARNALDCALWDLEAKLSGIPAWRSAGLQPPRSLLTTFTCGADEPEEMARVARSFTGARAIKLKLTGAPVDADRVRAVREARGDVWLGVDANQGFTLCSLEKIIPVLVEAGVSLIEQPLPARDTALLDGLHSPIPIAADESAQGLADLPMLRGRFDVVNIKLDKCGGLTDALAMARIARELGFEVMVGNMLGTSLAMAPAFLVGQLCSVVDLDGPIYLASDRATTIRYIDGHIECPPSVWGN